MPAKEDTYRNQRLLHIVFAISSVAMFVSITWMIVADHFREWKKLQRDFVKFDAAKSERDARDAQLLASNEELRQLEAQLDAARQEVADTVAVAQETIDENEGQFQKKDQELSFLRADRDSIISLIDIAKDKGNQEGVKELEASLSRIEVQIVDVRGQAEELEDRINEAKKLIAQANDSYKVTDLEKEIANKKKEQERIDQKKWTFSAMLRSSPILDAFSPAVKIEQVVLNELPIHYSFKGVPRFDRCTTCHKGIDSVTKEGGPAYDSAAIENSDLTTSPFRDAFKTHPHPELFSGPNSPHPRERFGCTICHLGQGSGTEFLFASHTPNDIAQGQEWKEKYNWDEIHHWPWKMSRSRFVESGCIKCHPHVVDLESAEFGNTAPKLLEGYDIVREYGCFGCHEISGWKAGKLIGPDLRLEPQTEDERKKAVADPMNPPGRMRKVGPSLRRIAEKVPEEWTARWIKLPKGFRPSTRMPQFYGLSNNDGQLPGTTADDLARSAAEIRATTFYLYAKSTEYLDDVKRVKALGDAEYQEKVDQRQALELRLQDRTITLSESERKQVTAQLDALKNELPLRDAQDLPRIPDNVKVDPSNAEQVRRGRGRFIERGCLACHTHDDVKEQLPQAVQDFGPDLSNVALKLKNQDGTANTRWLFNWLKDPTVYHATSFMPNLQLKDDEAADIAAWLLNAEGSWATDPGSPELDDKVLDELITLFLQKSFSLRKSREYLAQGIPPGDIPDIRGDERMLDAPISLNKKLLYLGKKTIGRMGCFGCHDIPGFETAKPIGTELASWGLKARMDPDKLDFAHIVEHLEAKQEHDPDFELYLEGLKHHKGEAFLWQKLRDPRSYDFDKLKAWDDKLRMPRFPFADDPKKVEAVMTFVLGLVADDQIPQYYRNVPQAGAKFAMIEGEKALVKFNCRGCHMTQMPEVTFDLAKAELADPAGQHQEDFEWTKADQKAMMKRVEKKGGKTGTLSVMIADAVPDGLERAGEIPKDAELLALDVWEPREIDGKQFFIGDRITLAPDSLVPNGYKSAHGGQFAELLVSYLMNTERKKANAVWGFVPPPLVREGMKAQPAWLHQFLLNPIELRPAVKLRMPKFNMTNDEAAHLAGYFAAVDGLDYPYEHIRQRDSAYLAQMESQHPNYLRDAWSLLLFEPKGAVQASQKLCAGCHRVADRQPEGGTVEERGPNLVLAPDRLRPDWLRQWLSRPSRLLPYTIMPNNFSKATEQQFSAFFQGSSREQVIGVRDTLMNYHQIQQEELLRKTTAQAAGGN